MCPYRLIVFITAKINIIAEINKVAIESSNNIRFVILSFTTPTLPFELISSSYLPFNNVNSSIPIWPQALCKVLFSAKKVNKPIFTLHKA